MPGQKLAGVSYFCGLFFLGKHFERREGHFEGAGTMGGRGTLKEGHFGVPILGCFLTLFSLDLSSWIHLRQIPVTGDDHWYPKAPGIPPSPNLS